MSRRWRVAALAATLGASLLGLVAWAGPLVALKPEPNHAAYTASWVALVPPVLAIVITLSTRRLLPALGTAVVAGSFLRWGVVGGVVEGGTRYGWENLIDPWHLYIIAFTLTLLGLVQVVSRSGGTAGIVELVTRRVKSARASRAGVVVLGLFVFFDDYANCMLVGPAMRPLCDRFRVSREKLAYLVDCTAAPVAGLAIVSTWIGHEVGLLDEQARHLGLADSGYALVLSALPNRFYCIFALIFLVFGVLSGRDFGPMLRAERRAALKGLPLREGARPLSQKDGDDDPEPSKPERAVNAIVPIVAVVVAAFVGFFVDGGGWAKASQDPTLLGSLTFWRQTLGASENNVAMLFYASLVGLFLAVVLPLLQGLLKPTHAGQAFVRGVSRGGLAVLVLYLAWGLAGVCKDLGVGQVLQALLGDSVPPALVPLAVFGLAAAIAYSIGTSWGTMSILIPTALPLAHSLGDPTLFILTIGAVLDGAIFGDHCSPISDTTLMSSIAAGSDHLDHVFTQLPYALTAMSVAALLGYIPVAYGMPVWLTFVLGSAALLAILYIFGRRPEVPTEG